MKRREFISLAGGAIACLPVRSRRLAAQSPPVVGFLSSLSKPQTPHLIEALRRGLSEAGFMEGQSGTIDYRFAEGQYDRLPILAGELVRRAVSLIVAAGPPAALAA